MGSQAIVLSGLARRLVRDSVLNEEEARLALEEATKAKLPLPIYLSQKSGISALTIATAASEEFGTPLCDLRAVRKDSIPVGLVDKKLISKHHALPLFKRGNRLFVALTDPTNLHAIDEIKFNTGLTTEAVLAEADILNTYIEAYLNAEEESLSDSLGGLDGDGLDIEAVDEEGRTPGEDTSEIDETPIVRFVNKVLLDAIKIGASDIHFEPYEKTYRVRYRTDGILKEVARPPTNLAPRISARLKVMSQMDISERRVPQDGRIKMKLSKTRAIDFRVNTLPTLFGEKVDRKSVV